MELPTNTEPVTRSFKRNERFEIDEHKFKEIQIDENRVIAKGKSWETFEILISFIGAAWMEKWRRFGTKVLAAGIFIAGFPIFGTLIPGFTYAFWSMGPALILLIVFGGILILLWLLVKREALKIYTPGGVFKIEGSTTFVDDVWKAITKAQRLRDV